MRGDITLSVPVTEDDIEQIQAGEWVELEGEGLTIVLGSPDAVHRYKIIKEWLDDEESDGEYRIEQRTYSGDDK